MTNEQAKKKTLWAVFDPKGSLMVKTIRWQRKDAVHAWEYEWGYTWAEGKKYGWTVRKILISKFTE